MFLKIKLRNIELPYVPEIPRLSIYPKEVKAGAQRVICVSIVLAAVFTIAKGGSKPSVPQWMTR